MMLLIVIAALMTITHSVGTSRPVIGILSLPCTSVDCPNNHSATTYISASYVKWIESGGARVVPIKLDSPRDEIAGLVSKLNGVVFTGGHAPFSIGTQYLNAITTILDTSRSLHKRSNGVQTIPIWSTCLGFQAMLCVTAGTTSVLKDGFDSYDYPINLKFNSKSIIDGSQLFNSSFPMADYVRSKTAVHDITMNNHHAGIEPTSFKGNERLVSNFTLMATSVDRKGREFVTLVESHAEIGLKWFGAQFHSEKIQYEWDAVDGKNIPRGLDAIISNQYFSTLFLEMARTSNDNVMTVDEVTSRVIYNDRAVYIDQKGDKDFEQVYMF